jgi:hypothetical protein
MNIRLSGLTGLSKSMIIKLLIVPAFILFTSSVFSQSVTDFPGVWTHSDINPSGPSIKQIFNNSK